MSYYNQRKEAGEKCDCQSAPADIAAQRQAIRECIDRALTGANLHENADYMAVCKQILRMEEVMKMLLGIPNLLDVRTVNGLEIYTFKSGEIYGTNGQ